MAFNWFKKKEESIKPAKEPIVKAVEKVEKKTVSPAVEEQAVERTAKKANRAHVLLLRPVVTEKSTYWQADGKYCFEVVKDATKTDIKKAIEAEFGVHIIGMNIQNYIGKVVRYGRTIGRRNSRRRAVVTLKKGEQIEIHKSV